MVHDLGFMVYGLWFLVSGSRFAEAHTVTLLLLFMTLKPRVE